MVLVFRHVPFETAGYLGEVLDKHGVAWTYIDLWNDPDRNISLNEVAAVVSLGGPMSANDDLAAIRTEIGILRNAIARNIPVLGICLGAQLLARAFDAPVVANPVKEIGWAPVWLTDEGAADPLLAGLDQPEWIFHWHGETFALPEGGVHLARSEACRHQAFRVGDRFYGLQFHLETTPDMITCWLTEDSLEGDRREVKNPIEPAFRRERYAEIASLIFGRWSERFARLGQREALGAS